MRKSNARIVLAPATPAGWRNFKRAARTLPAILLMMFFFAGATSRASAQTQPPQIFFTDLDSGPNSGGESVSGFSGAYVTIYGDFFGASQGSSTITWNGLNCLRVLGPTGSYNGWGSSHFWYQEIVVQLGSGCTPGTGNFVVTVNGAASNGMSFTVRSTGHIYAVSTTGSNSNNGSFASPFATIPHCKDQLTPGDTCYIENGVTASTVDDFSAAISMTNTEAGETQLSGTAGNPIALVAYPGATVTVGLPASSAADYGLRVPYIGVTSSYVTIAGITFSPTQEAMDAAGNPGTTTPPVVVPSTNWRVIANLFECPDANQEDGCFNSHELNFIQFLGNEATNIATACCSGSPANKEQHAVYFSSDTNDVVAAWNYIHDNLSCRAIQFFSSPLNGGGASDPTGKNQYDLSVHDNLLTDDPCDGINFATVDPSQGKVEAYNNLIYHVGIGPAQQGGEDSGDFSCIYIAEETNTTAGTGTIEIYNNTMYDCGSYAATYPNNGAIMINSGEPDLLVDLRNNIMYQIGASSESAAVNGGSTAEPFGNGPADAGGAWVAGTVSGTNNLLYSTAGATLPTFLAATVNSDPMFQNLGLFNFHLQTGSPAINAGVIISSSNTYNNYLPWNGNPTDLDGVLRPQGTTYTIGAYEFFTGADNLPNPPTNLSVVVN